jgi:hypothetical protein
LSKLQKRPFQRHGQRQQTSAWYHSAQIYTEGNTHVSVDIENTGKRAGVETVQFYVRERFTPVATPIKQLRDFERVTLDPGQRKTVSFTLRPEDLQLLDRDMRWVVVTSKSWWANPQPIFRSTGH